MPGIRETRRLPYSCEQMFDLVADVERYGEFLPWVVATRVKSDSETEMVADMLVGFKALREKFTSKVFKKRPNRDRGRLCRRPVKGSRQPLDIRAHRRRRLRDPLLCRFPFKNLMFEALAGQYFDRAFRKMVAAFETRAEELYGNSSSSAQSVA